MSYTQNPNDVLRLGDVLTGYVSSVPLLKEPSSDNKHIDYSLDLSMPAYSVVLSPCCSIGNATLTLVPLEQVNKKLFANPYFVEDLTRINKPVPPELAIPPDEWDKLSEEAKDSKRNVGKSYTFAELFIYLSHGLLLPYEITYRKNIFPIGHYMIDFQKIFRVRCELVRSSNSNPTDQKLLDSKILQLSVDSRDDLRKKLAWYFGREPIEDRIAEAAL